MEEIVVIITASNEDEAVRISKALLEEKLVACVNIHPKVRSLYWWEGKIQDEGEAMMIIKTRRGLLGDIIKKVKEIHSYTVPEIIALPIIEGSEDYLRWVQEVTRKD
ncbi:MAG: divalent-cation tolerance protein CutA [Nitrospirae bacterium]|nr:divalent-cation tolerance protein CutA [Nitrospirota bacterium]